MMFELTQKAIDDFIKQDKERADTYSKDPYFDLKEVTISDEDAEKYLIDPDEWFIKAKDLNKAYTTYERRYHAKK